MSDRFDLKLETTPQIAPDRPSRLRQIMSGRRRRLLAAFLGWTLVGFLLLHFWPGAPLETPWLAVVAYAWGVLPLIGIFLTDRLRERELNTSRLEGQLAQANLEMLKMQLHPHFLFNTLNAISALMHRDVDAADSMITRLSDFLRMSLEKDDRHQVPLSSELEFLERYLAIEKVRFRDRLTVEIDVEEPCLEAQVPRLILQPLVENAIRHGVAMRSAAGSLAIRAREVDGRLQLVVGDDGPGLPPKNRMRISVGLENSRARLAQIYGGDYSFMLVNVQPVGLEARIEIPFEVEPRPEVR